MGANQYGQLGIGNIFKAAKISSPTLIENVSNFKVLKCHFIKKVNKYLILIDI